MTAVLLVTSGRPGYNTSHRGAMVLVPPSRAPARVHPRVQLVILLAVVIVNWAYVLWRFGRGGA